MTLPDVDTLAGSLGGTMQNYSPVEDPNTDLDAAYDNRARCDVAMMTHTATRAWARITLAATTGAMVLVAHDAQWGNSAPVAPALARTGTGVFTLTWPSAVNDELAASHTVNLRGVHRPNVRGATLYHVLAEVTAANVVTVRAFNSAGAASDAAGVDIDVFVL